MIGFKWLARISVMFFGFNLQSDFPVMELNNVIRSNKVDSFIANKLDSVGTSYRNPIFPYKVNFKSRGDSITFCGVPVIDYWALKLDSSYTFFLLVKQSSSLVSLISQIYGRQESEIESEINSQSTSLTSYAWETDSGTILLRSFMNVEMDKKHYGCSLIVIGNMRYIDIVSMPPLRGF